MIIKSIWIPKNLSALTFLFCCLAALLFPFSIAAVNALFFLALLLSLYTGDFKRGCILLWQKQKWLFQVILFYLFLVAAGILWSNDQAQGLGVLMHHSKWLLLPLILPLLMQSAKHRGAFIAALSLGLTLHLAVCVAQMFGVLHITNVAGSNASDATGYIGHISFGVTYAIWAGWLILWGKEQQSIYYKWGAWLLALWAFTMVFMAEGRSGYLSSVAVILYLVWHIFIHGKSLKFMMTIGVLLVFSSGFVVIQLSDHPRATQTIKSIQAIYHNDLEHAELRVFLWLSAFDIWKQNPILGAGTGGYRGSMKQMQQDYPMLVSEEKVYHSHPHQLYLLAAARWGTVGVLTIILLLWTWYSVGRSSKNSYVSLASISALALATHGFTSIGLEAFQPISMGMFALALAIASQDDEDPAFV